MPSFPAVPDSAVELLQGDVLAVLRTLADESVDCVVTSPPYWGLRDYGTGEWEGGDPECDHARPTTNMNVGFNERWGQGAGDRKQERKSEGQYAGACPECGAVRVDDQIGLEPTPEAYVAKMVEVFREIRRVLAPHGTVWLNLGDSYVSSPSGSLEGSTLGSTSDQTPHSRQAQVRDGKAVHGDVLRPYAVTGLPPKNLVGIPWRVAFALQADGWWLRSDIVWDKPNAMPESTRDRPTKSHEYLFLLTKSARYYFDSYAVRETASWSRWGDQTNGKHEGSESAASWIGDSPRESLTERGTRNVRSVWRITTQPFPGAHFATFPEELAQRAIAAGCPREVCVTCGRPRERIVETRIDSERPRARAQIHPPEVTKAGQGTNAVGSETWGHYLETTSLGWSDCGCAYGLEADATELIESPVGEGGAIDPSLEVGRAGFERERAEDEGVRLITRFEQRSYAEQLRASPARQALEAEVGETTFAHYIRTDRVGARPLSADLLERLIADGTLERVTLPPKIGTTYRRGVVLDPFVGSGTVAVCAKRSELDAIGIDLSPDYLELAHTRLTKWWRPPPRSGGPKQMDGQTSMDELLA